MILTCSDTIMMSL